MKCTKWREYLQPSVVQVVKLGRKSCQLLASGGEDCKVNLYHLGQQSDPLIASLTGHSSTITSLHFDNREEFIVAGSEKGSLKLWSLEEQKSVRSFKAAHRSCVTVVDFHPFGEYCASGSTDTNIKVWDIRGKICLQTHKGHNYPIQSLRFTPDGKWLVSGDESGVVRLWDLTAGKPLHEFVAHENGITCLDFHPSEFLLATGSLDKTIKFWDLDQFQLISSTDLDMSACKALLFSSDGDVLYGATNDTLKVWTWEPRTQCLEVIDTKWNGIDDMILHPQYQIVGASHCKSTVTVYTCNNKSISSAAVAAITSNIPTATIISTAATTTTAVVTPPPTTTAVVTPPTNLEPTTIIPSEREYSIPLPVQSFLPKQERNVLHSSDQEIIDELLSTNGQMCVILNSRLNHLRILRNLWLEGDVKECISTIVNDHAIAIDFLKQILKPENIRLLTLDICVLLLPLLQDIIHNSNYEDYLLTAIQTTHLLYKSFSNLIQTNLQQQQHLSPFTMDLNREARIEKCNTCVTLFHDIATHLTRRMSQPVPMSVEESAKELLSILKSL